MATAGASTLLALLVALCKAAHLPEREERSGSGSGSGSGDSDASSEPGLGGEAIANIASSAAALAVLGGAICYLLMCFNKQERMQRVRAAKERNRQISRQLEASRQARKAAEQQTDASRAEEGRDAGSLLFSQEHRSHMDDDDSGRSRDPSQPLVIHSPTSKHPST